MSESCDYIKVDDLTWVVNGHFEFKSHTVGFEAMFPEATVYVKSFPKESPYSMGYEVFIKFKDESDEAEFIMREIS